MTQEEIRNKSYQEVIELTEILNHARMIVETKSELFLRLCSVNYLNALMKQDRYKSILNYGMIKPKVIYLTKNLIRNNKLYLCDELYIKPSEDCMYIRCYGLQFGFHRIGSKLLVEEIPQLCNEKGEWDGLQLQPIAEPLYEFAKETVEQNLAEITVKDKIQSIINHKK